MPADTPVKSALKTPVFATLGCRLNAYETEAMKELSAGAGIENTVVNKVYEGRPNIVDMLKNKEIALVMNTTEGAQAVEDSREIRSAALYGKIPYFTTAAASNATARAMKSREEGDLTVTPLQGNVAKG